MDAQEETLDQIIQAASDRRAHRDDHFNELVKDASRMFDEAEKRIGALSDLIMKVDAHTPGRIIRICRNCRLEGLDQTDRCPECGEGLCADCQVEDGICVTCQREAIPDHEASAKWVDDRLARQALRSIVGSDSKAKIFLIARMVETMTVVENKTKPFDSMSNEWIKGLPLWMSEG